MTRTEMWTPANGMPSALPRARWGAKAGGAGLNPKLLGQVLGGALYRLGLQDSFNASGRKPRVSGFLGASFQVARFSSRH